MILDHYWVLRNRINEYMRWSEPYRLYMGSYSHRNAKRFRTRADARAFAKEKGWRRMTPEAIYP